MRLKVYMVFIGILYLTGCTNLRPSSSEAKAYYEPEMASLLLEFSEFAYITNTKKLEDAIAQNYPNYTVLYKTNEKESGYGSQGFIAHSDEVIIISVRGSEGLFSSKDWVNNAKFGQYTNKELKELCPDAGIHGGFFQSALRIRAIGASGKGDSSIYDSLINLQSEGRRLYLTGHSLGGATADILAMLLAYESSLEVEGIYTYGEPKNGDIGYQKCHDTKLRDRTFRFVNRNDLVTRLPPFSDFVHVGNLIWFNSKREAITCNITEAMEEDGLEIPLASGFHHRLNEYRSGVKELSNTNPFNVICD